MRLMKLTVKFTDGTSRVLHDVGSFRLENNNTVLTAYSPETWGRKEPIESFVLANLRSWVESA